ncbi:metalloprotease [Brevundimonas sp.]|uniref:metalloprotease n=1 Tax=Brevundimonas sp. TaxID=1871086 RepID=UPI003AF78BE6
MSDTLPPNHPSRPAPPAGPWGSVPTTPAQSPEARVATAPEDKGQPLVWSVLSTLLLGGFIWWISGSWVIAVAAIIGLFVHEYGHVLAMNRLGMGPARVYIIPFLGGLARGQRMPKSEWDGVLVSLAGPAFGLLAALPFFALYFGTGQTMWLNGVFAIGLINLVNLAPAPPLDGSKALGPVLARIHPMVEYAVMIAIGALVVWWGVSNGSFIFAAFLAIALIGHLKRGQWRPEGRQLNWREAGYSVGLFGATATACLAVTGAAFLIPTGGDVNGALDVVGRFLSIGR